MPSWTDIDPSAFMVAVGVVEFIAGIVVCGETKIRRLDRRILARGIIINLLLVLGYYDVALHVLELSFGALALARLAERQE